MKESLRRMAIAYFAGALGGLAYALAAWMGFRTGLFHWLGAAMGTIHLNWPYLAHRLVSGSLWGLLLVVLSPLFRAKGIGKGILLGLIPSAYTLLVYYPRHGWGWWGAGHGAWVFVVIILLNAVWGLVANGLYNLYYRS